MGMGNNFSSREKRNTNLFLSANQCVYLSNINLYKTIGLIGFIGGLM
jgi:hypothetical protein